MELVADGRDLRALGAVQARNSRLKFPLFRIGSSCDWIK